MSVIRFIGKRRGVLVSGSNACRAVRGLVSALIGSLVVATMACAQDGAGKVTVTLHASETGPKISRHLLKLAEAAHLVLLRDFGTDQNDVGR